MIVSGLSRNHLPAKSFYQNVKVGDTWTSTSDISSDDGSAKIHTAMEHVNVLEGFETADGLKCIKVKGENDRYYEGKRASDGFGFYLYRET